MCDFANGKGGRDFLWFTSFSPIHNYDGLTVVGLMFLPNFFSVSLFNARLAGVTKQENAFQRPPTYCLVFSPTIAIHVEIPRAFYSVRQAGGGGVSGWVIRIIFDPNTRQWGGGGGFRGW